jgi:hypothetical protein
LAACFDCGDLGFGPIAAHGHADALSVTLQVGGHDVLVDPGTYDYFTYRGWRDYFRSTRAHNTLEIDGQDQSRMQGPFLWGYRATARCEEWSPSADGGRVAGTHDGYMRLDHPVRHARTVTLYGAQGELVVEDDLQGEGAHTARIHWHLSPACTVEERGPGRYRVSVPCRALTVEMEGVDRLEVVRGGDVPGPGWFSPGYHRKERTATLVGTVDWRKQCKLTTRIRSG